MSTDQQYTKDVLNKALENAKFGIDVEKNQDIIIKSKDPEFAFCFAENVLDANIEALQQVVLDSDDQYYCYLFASRIKGADIEKLSEVVLKGEIYSCIYWFANEVKGANIQKHIDVLKTKIDKDNFRIINLEEKLAKQKLVKIKNADEAYEEALKGINVKENENIVLKYKNAKLCYLFAKHIPSADILAHETIILNQQDGGFSFEFARDIEGAHIQSHINLLHHNKEYQLEAVLKDKLKKINDKQILEYLRKEEIKSEPFKENGIFIDTFKKLSKEDKDTIISLVKEGKISNNTIIGKCEAPSPKKEYTKEECYSAYHDVSFKKIYDYERLDKVIESKYIVNLCYEIINIPKEFINSLYTKIEQKTIESKDYKACISLIKYKHKDCNYQSLVNVIKEYGDPGDIYWAYNNCPIKTISFQDCMNAIPKNNDIAINFLSDFITVKCYEAIKDLEKYHPDVINSAYLSKRVIYSDNYSDEFKKLIQEAIDYLNSKNKPKSTEENVCQNIYSSRDECKTHLLNKEKDVELVCINIDKDKEETLQYIDYWIREIKQNDLYAIEILKNIIENKFYDRIDALEQYHPNVININFLKNLINGNYPDNYKQFFEEAIAYLNFKNKPKPIEKSNWLKENAIEGIYQGISQTVVKNLAKSIVEFLKLNKVDEPSIFLAEKFLTSPAGISILFALVGAGIHFIPAKLSQDNIHIQKIGDKCIQSCSAIGSEHLINLAINFVLPAITNAISSNKQIAAIEMLEAKPKAIVNVEEDSDIDLYEKLAAIAAKK
jgi:hypothetical protein